MDIDIKTLFFLFSAGNLFIILFFSTYILLYKIKNPIINIFIVAKVLLFILWLLFSLRNSIPDFYSILIANVFFIFAICYENYSITFAQQDFNRKQFLRLNLIPVVLSVVFLAFLSSSENTRVIIASFIITLIFMVSGLFLAGAKSKSKIQHLTGYFYIGVSLLYLYRAVWALFIDSSTKLFTSTNLHIATYTFLFMVSFSGSILLLLILKEKDEKKIENDNLKLQKLISNKDKFFSIIAHDLRGPLSNLIQLGKLLTIEQDEIKEESRREITEAINDSSIRTYNLLDNLLKWASSNSGIMKYNPEQINLKEIVHENLKFLTPQSKLKNIVLTNSLNEDLLVYADCDMINTVIRNLISNALKFTTSLGTIEVVSKPSTNNVHTIGVVDNGIGMDQNVISKVLEIESTFSTPGTENEKGSGLGLKLCKEFVLKNNGDIWIESTENIGTKIWISLPQFIK